MGDSEPAAPPTAMGWGEELLVRAVRHRPHGPGLSGYMPARDRTTHWPRDWQASTPLARPAGGRRYIIIVDRTGPGDVESTGREYSESLVRT